MDLPVHNGLGERNCSSGNGIRILIFTAGILAWRPAPKQLWQTLPNRRHLMHMGELKCRVNRFVRHAMVEIHSSVHDVRDVPAIVEKPSSRHEPVPPTANRCQGFCSSRRVLSPAKSNQLRAASFDRLDNELHLHQLHVLDRA